MEPIKLVFLPSIILLLAELPSRKHTKKNVENLAFVDHCPRKPLIFHTSVNVCPRVIHGGFVIFERVWIPDL